MTRKLAKTYTYRDLVANGLLLYNKEVVSNFWELSQSVKETQGSSWTTSNYKFIALLSEVDQLEKKIGGQAIQKEPNSRGKRVPVFPPWRFENPNNLLKMTKNKKTYK